MDLNVTDKEALQVLEKLLDSFLKPSFGALPKSEIEHLFFNALIDLGLVPKSPEAYELVGKLRVTQAKARKLIYEHSLRTLSVEQLDKAVRQLLTSPVISKSAESFVLEFDNPLVADHVKAIVKRLGYISDSSFSPSLIKLNQAVFIQLYVEMMGMERLKEAKAFLIKAGAPDTPATGVIKSMLVKLAKTVADETGREAEDHVSEYLTDVLNSDNLDKSLGKFRTLFKVDS